MESKGAMVRVSNGEQGWKNRAKAGEGNEELKLADMREVQISAHDSINTSYIIIELNKETISQTFLFVVEIVEVNLLLRMM